LRTDTKVQTTTAIERQKIVTGKICTAISLTLESLSLA
jgi:hypothetical protein